MLHDLGDHLVTSLFEAAEREIRNGLQGVQFDEDQYGETGWALRIGAEDITFTNNSWRGLRLLSMPTPDAIRLVAEFRAGRAGN